MRKFLLICLLFTSCGQVHHSDIEVIKLDTKTIDSIKHNCDTSYTEFIGHSDFYTADYYVVRKGNVVVKLLKDSLGNIVGINKSKGDQTFFAAEYYPNGQLKGKLPGGYYSYNLSGLATYYYEDGRIRTEGKYKNGTKVGEWKNYDPKGREYSINCVKL